MTALATVTPHGITPADTYSIERRWLAVGYYAAILAEPGAIESAWYTCTDGASEQRDVRVTIDAVEYMTAETRAIPGVLSWRQRAEAAEATIALRAPSPAPASSPDAGERSRLAHEARNLLTIIGCSEDAALVEAAHAVVDIISALASTCALCRGSGYQIEASGPNAPDARDVPCVCMICDECDGSGVDDVDVEQTPDAGLTVTDIPCRACGGKGVRS